MSVNLFDQLQATLGTSYRLERELGGGGMSRVFLAHETALDRRVVVKVLLPELAAGVSVERFRREIQLAAKLQHPHIVPLLSAGDLGGLPYFTMPFIVGESLRVRLDRSGELPINEAVRILRDVVSALAYAHEKGVMHRDVKPDNVLLSGGVAVVTDFGVAKAVSASSAVAPAADVTGLTSLGVALGTPNYMAPEQASGDPQIDHRVDIYSLGVMAYEMFAGRRPFVGRSTQGILTAHVIETPEPVDRLRPSMPFALASLVMECLAKRPADRPQSAAEVLQVLDNIATPTGGTATTRVTALPAPAPERRGVGRFVAAAVMGVAVLGIAAAAFLALRDSSPSSTPTGATPPAPTEPTSPAGADSVADVAPVAAPAEPAPHPRMQPSRAHPRPRRPPPSAVEAAANPQPPQSLETLTPQPPSAPAAPPLARMKPESVPAEPAEPEPARPPHPPANVVAPQPTPVPQTAPVPQPAPQQAAQPNPVRPPAPAPPSDVRPEIQATIAAYAVAIESRNVDNMRRVYPNMTTQQQRGWEQFFETVRNVQAHLSIASMEVANGTADVRVSGSYAYLNNTTGREEQQPVSFRATLRQEGGSWRMLQVR